MCVFCKIASGEIVVEPLFADEKIMAFRDAHPIAPVHVLLIPKRHIESVNDLASDDEGLMGHLILTAQKIASDLQISAKGYKLLIRTGKDGGQEVPHLHLHLLGGAPLFEEIRPKQS